jgi:two-component system chemotaxis sensor kinase CheA
MGMTEFDEIIQEFLAESQEGLDQLDRDLVVMEQGGATRELLAGVFRVVHTIKGTCGFLGFSKLETVAHRGENLLSRLRDGKLTLTPEITSALLTTFDAIRQIMGRIEADGNEGDGDYSELVATLEALSAEAPAAPLGAPDGALGAPAARSMSPDGDALCGSAALGAASPRRERDIESASDSEHRAGAQRAASAGRSVDPRRALSGSRATPERAEGAPSGSEATSDEAEPLPGLQRITTATDTSIRVDVGHLDRLMNLVGELVLARNALLSYAPVYDDLILASTCQRLNAVTSELQEGVMKTRLQPIDTIWRKLPRVIRDLAATCGKRVQLQMEGRETELDKTIIEAIKDPITHLIRNAVDHGIEPLDVRVRRAKSVDGSLSLRASHEGGQVVIEIADDGGGIDPEVIKKKALGKGLISADQAARMSDREALNLIFLPGFSTAESVTNISGRGVGMDVVRTNVEKIGGAIEVQSEKGRGTTFRIRLPLTLAILPVLIVTAAGDRYAIPRESVQELVRVKAVDVEREIQSVDGALVYRLRDRLLPLVSMREALGVEPRRRDDESSLVIVVLQVGTSSEEGSRQIGLIVDQANDTQEIVVKPLARLSQENPPFSGATVLGDGCAALILDVPSFASRTGILERGDLPVVVDEAAEGVEAEEERETLLLFGAGVDGRLAVPLSLVTRLEQFPRSAVERSGERDVVEYHGQPLPLIWLSRVLNTDDVPGARCPVPGTEGQRVGPGTGHRAPGAGAERLRVLVHSHADRSVGLVVDRILDVVEETVTLLEPSPAGGHSRPGIIGTSIIRERVTELLDLPGVIRATVPEFFGKADVRCQMTDVSGKEVLSSLASDI